MEKFINVMKCVATMACITLLFSQCAEDEKPGSKTPVVTSFSPTSVDPGGEITITGSKFGTSVENVIIHLHDQVVSFEIDAEAVVDNQIQCFVPNDITPGDYHISVEVEGLESSMSEGILTIRDVQPEITSFSPASVIPGNQLTINGVKFGANPDNVVVYLQGTAVSFPVEVETVTESQIVLIIPNNFEPGTYRIALTVNGIASAVATGVLTVEDVRPIISSFSPTSIIPGNQLVISGSHFGTHLESVEVYFQGNGVSTPMEVSAVTDSQIQLTIPMNIQPGTYTISVGVNGVNSIVTSTTLTVQDIRPVIASFSPTSGVVGDRIVISGSGFGTTLESVQVFFSGNGASGSVPIQSVTNSEIQLLVPNNAPGVYQIAVVVNGTSSGFTTSTFTIN